MEVLRSAWKFALVGQLCMTVAALAYEAIPLSQVPPFYATKCGGGGKNYRPNLIFYMDKSGSMHVDYAQDPSINGPDPTTYNGGKGIENFWWNKWASHVFHMVGTQGMAQFQVPLEIVTNLSYGTADTDLAQEGLTPAQISTLRTTGMFNPNGDGNMFFTGAWVKKQSWVLPLQKPDPDLTPPGNDCWGSTPGKCYGRWINEQRGYDIDGPNTALVTPAPVNIIVAKWIVKDSLKSRPTLRQSLVTYPKWCDANGRCFAGVIFTADDPLSTKLARLENLGASGSTPMANGFAEMLRWLSNGPSYNIPGSTYCSGGLACSPLDYPGDPDSPFSVLLLGDGQNWNDCRIPSKQATFPYSGEPSDFDGDGGHDPTFPDYNALGHCPEAITNNWIADDAAYYFRTVYPKAPINTIYMGSSAVYGDSPTTCLSGDKFCKFMQRVAKDMPPGVTPPNNDYIATRWGSVESIINQVVSDMGTGTQDVETTLPSFGGTCSTFLAIRSEWLVPITDMAAYTAKLYRIKPDAGEQLILPPPSDDVLWEFGSILRSADIASLKVQSTLDGRTAADFTPTNSTLVSDLSSDNPSDPYGPNWNSSWPTTTDIQNAIKYIRGEQISGMRDRSFLEGSTQVSPWPLGEIFTSPLVIGPPRSGMEECFEKNGEKKCYRDFASANKNRTPMVAVETGDGQLHILNYNTGQQLYSFIPKAALQGLKDFPKPGYTRTAYVAGPLQAFDVYDDTDAEWKTVLIAGMAQGGQVYFALDITDPNNIQFMFEVSDPALGNSFSPVISARLKDNTAGEIFAFVGGSGYNNKADSNGSTAQIVAFDLKGNILKTLQVSDQLGNGTTSVYAQDANDDGTMDSLVVGTYKGELIEVKTPGSDFSKWSVSRSIADLGRPITAPIRMSRVEGQRYYYGTTGKLLTDADMNEDPPPQEYFFAFRDIGQTVALDDLTQYDSTLGEYDDNDPDTENTKYVTLSTQQESNKTGYKIALPLGHRGINPVMSLADGVTFATTNPVKDTQCTYGGRSITWYVSEKLNPQFVNTKGDPVPNVDVDGNGIVDDSDKLNEIYPVGRETTSATFNVNPQIDMKSSVIDVVTIELYNNIQATDGLYYATVGHTLFRNRLQGTQVNWKESTKIRK
ncbi:hypothetical protein L0156_15275 [bacterium]|nr:hypothetical protein [bacterium]